MELKKYKEIVFKIIGSAMAVHSEINWGGIGSCLSRGFECGTWYTRYTKQTRGRDKDIL